jgi:hypothetical protein
MDADDARSPLAGSHKELGSDYGLYDPFAHAGFSSLFLSS